MVMPLRPPRMDSETPPSLRHRLLKGAAALVALVLLYVLSSGPANYAAEKHPGFKPLVKELYEPLRQAVAGTPLGKLMFNYEVRWRRLAWGA